MSLLFKVSENKYYRKITGGSSHYLVEIYNKKDLILNRKEPLCGELNIKEIKNVAAIENITCMLCNMFLKKINEIH
jgi:hypothetical protein